MEYADMLMESDGFSSWGFKKKSSMMRSGNSDLESYLQWTLCLQKWYINKIALLVEAEQNYAKWNC